jgi:hypothetical protein
MKIARGLACLGLFSTLLLASANAEAQNAGFALNRFEPSERGSH